MFSSVSLVLFNLYLPLFHIGSFLIISLCRDLIDIVKGSVLAAVDISTKFSKFSGYMSANAKADIPPMDGPITVCAESIPSSFNKNNPAFDISSIDRSENLSHIFL